MNNLFDRTSSNWVRYSAYEWKRDMDGILYLTPAKNAHPNPYNPLEAYKALVPEAIDIGVMGIEKAEDKAIQEKIRQFAVHYGLLGLMTALPTTPEFMDYNAVYLPKNQYIRKESMKTEDYLSLFFPFDKPDLVKQGIESIWRIDDSRRKDREMIALAMTMGDLPMAVNMSFQRAYAERYEWMKQQFIDWTFHMLTCKFYYDQKDQLNPDTRHLMEKSSLAFGGIAPTYYIALLEKPTIIWQFHSLLLGIQMMYSFMLTDADNPIRLCNNCRKAFIASEPGQKFCSPACEKEYGDGQKQ